MTKPILDVVHEIKSAIDNDPLSRKRLNKLVPDIYLSRNKFQPSFKMITGDAIASYRLKKRMEAATIILLNNADITILEVAFRCGYKGKNGGSNFTRDFKKVYRKAPGEWVLLNRKNEKPA